MRVRQWRAVVIKLGGVSVAGADFKKYMCVICGFIFDEAEGRPEEGIPAGTRWEDVPIYWACPDCGATKEDFEMIEI